MSRGTKIGLIIAGVLVLLCLIASVVILFSLRTVGEKLGESVATDPAAVAESAHEILDYELPDGYKESMGMELFGIKMAMIISEEGEGSTAIMLMEMPTSGEVSQEEMERQFSQMNPSQGSLRDFEQTGTEEVTINGQDVTLVIREGRTENSSGKIRQMLGAFKSKSGNTAMLMIMGPVSGWDEEGINDFLESIR